jgi:uncharacterized protein (DUF697 family)
MTGESVAAFLVAMFIIWIVASPIILIALAILSFAWNIIKLAWYLVVLVGAVAGGIIGALLWVGGWCWELGKKKPEPEELPFNVVIDMDEPKPQKKRRKTLDLQRNAQGVYVPRNS